MAQPTKFKDQGSFEYAQSHYEKAIVAFSQAVMANPGDGEARIYLQNSYLKLSHASLFKLAIAGPFSGENSPKGLAELQGAAFAQEKLNGQAGQSPHLLLELADDQSTTSGAIEVAKNLADDSQLVGVVGHLDSSATWAALPMYNLAGLPVISPSSTSIQITGLSPNFFRLSPDDSLQGAALAKYVTGRLAAKRIAVLAPASNPAIQGLTAAFEAQAASDGAGIQRLSYPDNAHWDTLCAGLAANPPDAILMAGSYQDAVAFEKAKQKAGLEAPVLGGDALYLQALLQTGGSAVEGLICGTYFYPAINTPQAKRFEAEFEGKLNQPADSRAALTSEALTLFAQAAAKVGPSREALAHYLKTLEVDGFDSLSGHAEMDGHGNVRRPLYLMQVKNGRFVPLTQVVL